MVSRVFNISEHGDCNLILKIVVKEWGIRTYNLEAKLASKFHQNKQERIGSRLSRQVSTNNDNDTAQL